MLADLAGDECRDGGDAVEVFGHEVLIIHLDLELALDERDELHGAGRVDDAAVEQGIVVTQLLAASKQEILPDVIVDLGGNGHRAPSGSLYCAIAKHSFAAANVTCVLVCVLACDEAG